MPPNRPPKYRVATPSTNPLTSPSFLNRNGTRLPAINNRPTVAIGGTGAFGAMLPKVVPTGYTPSTPFTQTPISKTGPVYPISQQTAPVGVGSFLAAQGTQALSYQPYGAQKLPTPKNTIPRNPAWGEGRGDAASQRIRKEISGVSVDLERFDELTALGLPADNVLPQKPISYLAGLSIMKSLGLDVLSLKEKYNATIDVKNGLVFHGGAETAGTAGTEVPFGTQGFNTGGYFEDGKFVRTTDAQGNPWSADTATTDIYGGRFIQAGETRWERNRNGKLVKVRYLKGGKKEVVKRKGSGTNPVPGEQQQTQNQTVSGNLNTATG